MTLPGLQALFEKLEQKSILKFRHVPELVVISDVSDASLHYASKDLGKTLCGISVDREYPGSFFDSLDTDTSGAARFQGTEPLTLAATCELCRKLDRRKAEADKKKVKLDARRQISVISDPVAHAVTKAALTRLGDKRRCPEIVSAEIEALIWEKSLDHLLLEEPLSSATKNDLRRLRRKHSLFADIQDEQ